MTRLLTSVCLILASSAFAVVERDTLVFGNEKSETAHKTKANLSVSKSGALGESSRILLPGGDPSWSGGSLQFNMQVDPVARNYFTIRLWGNDANHNPLTLHIDGKQIGYRHLGDVEVLDPGSDGPAYPGRFYYRTLPLPMKMTQGRQRVILMIQATGPISSYARDFNGYQKPMIEPSRGIYRAYTHTNPCFTPEEDEKQGTFHSAPPVRKSPGSEVMDIAMKRVNNQIDSLLKHPVRPCSQMQALFLAKAYQVRWTNASDNPDCVQKILASLDTLHSRWLTDPGIANAENSTWNPDWFGLGPSGQTIELMKQQLAPYFDEAISDGQGGTVKRRDGWRDMLVQCRDWHREHRRQYTNQSMINDLYGIYLANRGIAVLDASKALPEAKALRYLYESVGLEPWLGSEKDGKPTMPLGDSYFQLTRKGLTKELGFVGNYGEVIDWVCQILDATGPAYGQAGDARIRNQLVKIARARAPFRYPLVDDEGNRAMVQETIVGWRDTHFPGDVTYAQRPSWDGTPLEAAAATKDTALLGYAQQMIEDNQYFSSIERLSRESGFRTTFNLLGVPDRYEAVKSAASSTQRLPMSWDQPDFVFSDEEDGVVAIKNGREILYASLYWRARFAINFLGRVHFMTPEFDRIATVAEEISYTASGRDYKRLDWTNFGFGNGGFRYPNNITSAHAGEMLPIAKIPDGIPFKPGQENIHAGKGEFYQLHYGRYLIAMNMSFGKTFDLNAPKSGKTRDLVTGISCEPGALMKIAPQTTAVLFTK